MLIRVAVLGRGVLEPDVAAVRADDVGLTRGDGCFEGLLVRDGAVLNLDAHLVRLARSTAALGLPFDDAAWRRFTSETCSDVQGEAALKLVITRGIDDTATSLLTLSNVAPATIAARRDGISVVTLDRGYRFDAFADAPWLLGGVKTLSYAVNMAALREAERRGADDAIFVSSDGWALEATTGSLVWAIDRTLSTTSVDGTGILRGTTQELLFERAAATGWSVGYARATVEDLHAADGLWIVSAVRGPVEIVELDGKGRSAVTGTTRDLQRLTEFA